MARGQTASPYEPVVLAENISETQRAVISERIRQFPGVELQNAYQRNYPLVTPAAHILGYTGLITQAEYKSYLAKGYAGNEQVGQAGLEAQYEQYLRGVPGPDPGRGRRLRQSGRRPRRCPRPRRSRATRCSRRSTCRPSARSRPSCASGCSRIGPATGAAGVAMDPRTGQVLAMASYPTFDPNAFVQHSPHNNRLVTQYRDERRASSCSTARSTRIRRVRPSSP